MKTKKKMTIGIDDYIKVNKKLAREEELLRNGGRWVAKDRPHKNLKKYNRKRDKKNFDSYLSLFFITLYQLVHPRNAVVYLSTYPAPSLYVPTAHENTHGNPFSS